MAVVGTPKYAWIPGNLKSPFKLIYLYPPSKIVIYSERQQSILKIVVKMSKKSGSKVIYFKPWFLEIFALSHSETLMNLWIPYTLNDSRIYFINFLIKAIKQLSK